MKHQDPIRAKADKVKKILAIVLLMGLVFPGSPLKAESEKLTVEQQEIMRRYQEAELARQDSRIYIRVGIPISGSRSEGPYHIERSAAKISTAINLYTALVQKSEKAFGAQHPQTALFLNNLARLYEDQGTRLDLAEIFYKKSLEIKQSSSGPESIEAADILSDLANFYFDTGRYGEAEQLFKRCLGIRIKKQGKDSPRTALTLRSMGLLYQELGDYTRAEELFNETLDIQKRSLGPNNRETARTTMYLATLSIKRGDISRCDRFANEALSIISNPASAATSGDKFMAGMGTTVPLLLKGSILSAGFKASQYFNARLEKKDWAYYLKGLNDDAYPAIVSKRAWANKGMEMMLREAETQTSQTFGSKHPQMASATNNHAIFHITKKNWDLAIPASLRSNEINFNTVPSIFSMASESLKLKYIEKTELYRDILLSAVIGAKAKGESVSAALKWAMRMKGIVLESMIGEREVIRKGLNPELKKTYEHLQQIRQELSGLYVKGPEVDLEGYNARMAELAKQKDDLESKLSHGSAAFKEISEMFSATPDAVCSRMPQRSALIEYVEFINYAEDKNPPWMIAFVLEEGNCASPVMVDLGPSAPLEKAIKEWREELRAFSTKKANEEDARKRLDGKGKKVTALMWDPVASKVNLINRSIVYVSPDGPIHLMPFGALPVENGYLIEKTNTAYVSTGKDFLRSKRTGTRSGALLVGGVDFNMSISPQAQVASSETRIRGQCSKLNELQWNPLPGTAEEVDSISAALGNKNISQIILEGDKARKSNVRTGLDNARYVHLATHGFFLGDECGLNAENRGITIKHTVPEEDGQPAVPLTKAPTFHTENPLLLSGLALAGANNSWRAGFAGGNNDGYLLAMEVANLDLDGVDLVTLSACETGLGEIKRGEGVFGLKRSFVIAGAEALVMSLWSVPDKETKELMVDFYNRILSGSPRRDSFRGSQLKMMKSSPGGSYRHPFYWAAFQYMGVN
jgi:CHAT domain-containing protein/tetratricopeptide (TPR) repeat protein